MTHVTATAPDIVLKQSTCATNDPCSACGAALDGLGSSRFCRECDPHSR